MRPGKAFELLVKTILLHIGFSAVRSDGLYIFDGTPGQMIQGLADAHNADVLLEPPVQTPFYTPTILLIECKDYIRKVGLDTMRSALGLREDINHFDIVDRTELEDRRRNRRPGMTYDYQRFLYQVGVASMSGFTVPGQNFAATHRIPIIEFNKMPFWEEFCAAIGHDGRYSAVKRINRQIGNDEDMYRIIDQIASRSAVAITASGQMLFLYRATGDETEFDEFYSLHWSSPQKPWILRSGGVEYHFQLPKHLLKLWLENSKTDLDRKINAINCKTNFLSNMVVYYSENRQPRMKMISIDQYMLQEALLQLR